MADNNKTTPSLNSSFKDVAAKFKIGNDQLQEILKGMAISPDDPPTPDRLKGFEEICKLVQSGKSIAEAVKTICDSARNDRPAPKDASTASAGAITKTSEAAITGTQQKEIPEDLRNELANLANASGDQTLDKLPDFISTMTGANEDHLLQGIGGFMTDAYYKRITEGLKDPAFLQRVKEAMASGKSNGKSQKG